MRNAGSNKLHMFLLLPWINSPKACRKRDKMNESLEEFSCTKGKDLDVNQLLIRKICTFEVVKNLMDLTQKKSIKQKIN